VGSDRAIRRRRAAAAVALLALVGLIWGLAVGSGHGGGSHPPAVATLPPPLLKPPPRAKPTAVDSVLRYTDWIANGRPRRRELALTFDDGPSIWTPKLVKALRRVHAAATFFPVGYAIQRYPRNLRLERDAGFPVGDHTMNHPLLSQLTGAKQIGEIDGQAALLRRAHLPYPRLFRPPYGASDSDTRGLLQERRMLMVLWSVNPEDYTRPGSKRIVRRVLDAARPGAIVLLHDGGGDRSQTVRAVPRIVRRLRARGYRLVTVPRLLADDPPSRKQGPPPNL
jgi:peptidoglycan/xylan/chitin deacetylase (PgdA/CDA1 family)